jgi:hypothetical protein
VTDPDCHICGRCYWNGCDNDADYEVDVDLKRNGLPLYSGKVDLCAGHHRVGASGSMNLKWVAIEQALMRDGVRA